MKVLIVLIFAILGAALGQSKGEASLDEVFKSPRSGRIVYEKQMALPPTVAYACKSMFEASRLGSLSNFLTHFTRKSLIFCNNKVPASGVYKGQRGILEMGSKILQMAHVKESSYEIKHVDEARGICIVDSCVKGTFRRNNNTLDVHHTNFILFRFGKVRVWNLVDHDYKKTITSFQTAAENKFDQILDAFFRVNPAAMEKYISGDMEVQLPNLHPWSLLSERQHQLHGKPVSFIMRGKEGLKAFADLAENLIVNRTITVKYLYGNETSVISAWVLKPKELNVWNLSRKKMAARVLTIMYVCADFNDKGLMRSFRAYFNRPFMPWHMHQIGAELKKEGGLQAVEKNATILARKEPPSATGAAAPLAHPGTTTA
jgi:hypothetical protein